MKRWDHKKIIKDRIKRNKVVQYIDFIKQIVKSQAYVRRFLAIKYYRALQDEEYESAVILLQNSIRRYLGKQRRKHIIKKQRRAVQVLENFASIIIAKRRRKERLEQIRANLCRLRMEEQLRYWINQHRYLEIPEIEEHIYNINNPTTMVQRFIDNREERRYIRDHNNGVLRRRLDALNTDTNFITLQNIYAPSTTTTSRNTPTPPPTSNTMPPPPPTPPARNTPTCPSPRPPPGRRINSASRPRRISTATRSPSTRPTISTPRITIPPFPHIAPHTAASSPCNNLDTVIAGRLAGQLGAAAGRNAADHVHHTLEVNQLQRDLDRLRLREQQITQEREERYQRYHRHRHLNTSPENPLTNLHQNEGHVRHLALSRLNPPNSIPIPGSVPVLSHIPAAPVSPPIVPFAERLAQLEREFHNPQLRQIYRENRIMLPNGQRIVPGQRPGQVLLEGQATIAEIEEPDNIPRVTCTICMEEIPITRMIKLSCDHELCSICVKNMISSALGSITTDIPLRCPFFRSGCTSMIEPDLPILQSIIDKADLEKFEKYNILKAHIPIDKLRYCPNPDCEMPYELIETEIPTTPPNTINFLYYLNCFQCGQGICTYCNDRWHETMSCEAFKNGEQRDEQDLSKYIQNYCKKCPRCHIDTQKIQTREQEQYEQRTGLASGTSECHHVTCSNCKTDFCWTCLKGYSQHRYYHSECPNVDCCISFNKAVPSITQLPLGLVKYIRLFLYENDDNNRLIQERIYGLLAARPILTNPDSYPLSTETVFLSCTRNGIVKKLEGITGEYTFRQENKADFGL